MRTLVGIVGYTSTGVILNNSSIKNVYNAGELTGATDLNGIIKFRNENCKLDFENTYYLDNTTKGSNLFNEILNKVSADNLNSKEILNSLNKYAEENKKVQVNDEISVELKMWKLKENNEYITFVE